MQIKDPGPVSNSHSIQHIGNSHQFQEAIDDLLTSLDISDIIEDEDVGKIIYVLEWTETDGLKHNYRPVKVPVKNLDWGYYWCPVRKSHIHVDRNNIFNTQQEAKEEALTRLASTMAVLKSTLALIGKEFAELEATEIPKE
jgi:hypothetical protein